MNHAAKVIIFGANPISVKPYILAFKYTSKGRPTRFIKGLNSIVNNLADKENYSIVCTFNTEDRLYNNDKFIKALEDYPNLTYYFNEGIASKIQAINTNLDKLPDDWDILVNFSDDQIFTVYGFDNIIRKGFEDSQHGLDTFLAFHDGKQNRVATMSIIGKAYFSRFGYIYHPDFVSLWCDNAVCETAIILKRHKYMGDDVQIMRHEHPYNGHPELMDANYKKTESFYKQDQATFVRHKKYNFYIK